MNEETLLVISIAVVALVFVLLVVIFFWTFFTTKRQERQLKQIWQIVVERIDNRETDFRLYIILADIVSTLHETHYQSGEIVTMNRDVTELWEKNLRAELHKMHERLAG